MACGVCGTKDINYGHQIEIVRPDGVHVLGEICSECTYDILQDILQDVTTDFTGLYELEDEEEIIDDEDIQVP